MSEKKNPVAMPGYKELHGALRKTSDENRLIEWIQAEVDRADPRMDMLSRMLGRLNAIRAKKTTMSVMALLSKSRNRNVRAALSRNG